MPTVRLGLTLLVLLIALVTPATGQEPTPAAQTRLYLPTLSNGPTAATIFGVEVTSLAPARGLANLRDLSPTWIRRNALLWRLVEPEPGGGYRWDSPEVKQLEAEMIRASDMNLNLILIVRGSPAWAVRPHTADCAPINPEQYDDFARFLSAAVRRYSVPPYNVRYWEIGNEPDAFIFPTNSPYGCWGVEGDPYYGGEAYGQMLKRAYAGVKAANPAAQVLNGGLLLDRPYDPETGEGVRGRFFEGMLEAGAGESFDILSYHSYSAYNGTPDGNQGRVDWKPTYLRGLLERYGLDKPLLNSEGALLCFRATPSCTQAQAYAVARKYTRAMRDGLIGSVWFIYDSDNFRNTALIEPTNPAIVRPAHRAYNHTSAMLGGARYLRPLTGLPPEAEGYRFAKADQALLVVWSNRPVSVRLFVGAGRDLRCSGWDGTPLPCSAQDSYVTLEARLGARFVTYTP